MVLQKIIILLLAITITVQPLLSDPIDHIRVKATECSFKDRPSGIDINLKRLTNGSETVEISNFTLQDQQKTIKFGICRGLNTTCAGRATKGTSACLINKDSSSNATLTAQNSVILGSISKSHIRLLDKRIIYETSSYNNTCDNKKPLSARLEFFCQNSTETKPTFLRYENCTYIFEYGTKAMCDEAIERRNTAPKMIVVKDNANSSSTTSQPLTKLSTKDPKLDLNPKPKSAKEMHKELYNEAKKMTSNTTISSNNTITHSSTNTKTNTTINTTTTSTVKPATSSPKKEEKVDEKNEKEKEKEPENHKITNNTATNDTLVKVPSASMNNHGVAKMNKLHKFFMISLILMSLAGFVVVIFILDKKTRLRVPLSNIRRQARQALQPQPVPYTRVDNFNDSLDL